MHSDGGAPTAPAGATLREQATFYHAALLLGVVQPATVIEWADGEIAARREPPHALHEVSLTDPHDLTAFRRALEPLAEPRPTARTVRRLLAVVAADLREGRRDVTGTVHVMAQMRRMLPLPSAIERELDHLQDSHMLATAGVEGIPEASESLVRGWLAGFAVGSAGGDVAFNEA